MHTIVTKPNREKNHRFYACLCASCGLPNTIEILDSHPVLPVKSGDIVDTGSAVSKRGYDMMVWRDIDRSYYCICGSKKFSILSELTRLVSLGDLAEPYLDEGEISFFICDGHDTYRVDVEYDGEDMLIKADEIHYLVFSLTVIVEMQRIAKDRYLAVQSGEYENSEDEDDVDAFYDEDTGMWG